MDFCQVVFRNISQEMSVIMKLSIIVPVYNSEQYLKQTINSIQSQTMSDYELILIDDGGFDQSSKLCDEYAKTDARIIVVHQTNKGIGGARNQGLKLISGEYFGFVDNDDIIHPQMYEALTGAAEKENSDVVMSYEKKLNENEPMPDIRFDTTSIQVTKIDLDTVYMNMFSNSDTDGPYMAVWNKIYRSSILKGVQFPLSGSEDVAFNSRFFVNTKSFVRLAQDINLYYWVQRSSSEWHNQFSNYQVNTLKTYFIMSEEISRNAPQYSHYALIKTFRKILSSRYTYRKTKYRAAIKEIIKENKKSFFVCFRKNKSISKANKFVYMMCYYCPVFYTAFRLMNGG